MKNKLKRLLQSPALRGSLFYASFWSVFAFINSFMNLELAERGFSGLQIGTIGSIRSIVIMVMASVFSRIADRNNIRVKMLRLFMIFAAIGVTLFTFPRSFLWLVAATIFMAIWQSPLDSLGNSITVRMASRYQVDYGMMTFWGALAYAIMNLIGGYVWDIFSLKWIYITGAGIYILVSFIAGTLEEPQTEDKPQPQTPNQTETSKKQPLKPMIIVFLIGYFVFSLAFFNAFGFTGPILANRGASNFIIGLVGTLIGIGGMVARRSNRRILARISIQSVMMIAIVMGLVPIIVYGWVENIAILLLISIFRGAGWGMFSLCSIRFIDQQSSVENASTLQSSLIMLNTLSNIIASTLSGYLYDTNPTLIFTISTGAALVSLGIIFVVRRMNELDAKQEAIVEVVPEG